jgi:hypothetical protein
MINPIALVGFIDRMPQTTEVRRIRDYVIAITQMDERGAKEAQSIESIHGGPNPEGQ